MSQVSSCTCKVVKSILAAPWDGANQCGCQSDRDVLRESFCEKNRHSRMSRVSNALVLKMHLSQTFQRPCSESLIVRLEVAEVSFRHSMTGVKNNSKNLKRLRMAIPMYSRSHFCVNRACDISS